tara:strand:- start:609 stop:770 length:162 start_codon:yes stop_codon:yes gene_type:complete
MTLISTWINDALVEVDTDTVWAETFAHWDALVDTDTAALIATAVTRILEEMTA